MDTPATTHTQPAQATHHKGIPYPVTLEMRAAYGPLYRRYVRARRSGCEEEADRIMQEYRRLNEQPAEGK